MASNVSSEELTLPMGWDILDACRAGYAMDIGGSVVKVVYISKDDWVEPEKRKEGTKGILHLINFKREELDKALQFINENAYTRRNDSNETLNIYTTGFGGSQFGQSIKDVLNAKNTNLTEYDCFVQSFMYIARNIPRKDMLHAIDKPLLELIKKEIQEMVKIMAQFKKISAGMAGADTTDTTKLNSLPHEEEDEIYQDRPLIENKSHFPCLLVMCGSAFGIFIVNEDGSFLTIDGSHRGGKMFLGLGSLLTSCKSYEDLMELCAKGENKYVSNTMKEFTQSIEKKKTDEAEDFYQLVADCDKIPEDRTTFCFGQAVGKGLEDFRKEDLARCLLETMIHDLIQTVHLRATVQKINHVFFCGGFVNHRLSRKLITLEWLRRDLNYAQYLKDAEYIQPHFLRHGQSLGAIGALINDKLKWSEQNKAQ